MPAALQIRSKACEIESGRHAPHPAIDLAGQGVKDRQRGRGDWCAGTRADAMDIEH